MTELPQGSVIGILGGGQLGRMLSVAASRLGYLCHIYEPGAAPAGDVAHSVTTAPYGDDHALRAFAASVDVITYEFENVPTAALDLLESLKPIRPNRRALAISQDRIAEKTFLNGLGLVTAPWAPVNCEVDLAAAVTALGLPAILKTTRLGYDGKGQAKLTQPSDIPAARAEQPRGGTPPRLRRRHRHRAVRPRQRPTAGQRDRPPRPQLGSLDPSRLCGGPVRTTHPRRGRAALGRWRALRRCGDGKPDRRRPRPCARPSESPGHAGPSLRQGRAASGTEDGPCEPHPPQS